MRFATRGIQPEGDSSRRGGGMGKRKKGMEHTFTQLEGGKLERKERNLNDEHNVKNATGLLQVRAK